MKITTHRSHKKTIISLVILLLIAGGIVTAIVIQARQPEPVTQSSSASINYKPATPEQTQTGSDTKSQTITKDGSETESPTQTPPSSLGGKQSVAMTVPSGQQTGDVVRITTDIATVTSTGTCSIVIVSSGKSYSPDAVGVQPLSSSTTCKGYTIPASQLPTGTWSFSIMFENDTSTGSATGSVAVN